VTEGIRGLGRRFRELLLWEGSTRSVAILRAFLALLVWGEYGREILPHQTRVDELQLLGPVVLIAAGLMAAGIASRLSSATTAVLLGVLYFYLGLELGMKRAFYHHHSYLLFVAIALVALTPCGRSLSWDRWWALRRHRAKPESGPLWALALIRLQLALVYFWGAYDKTNWAFLSGARLSQIFANYYGDHEGVHVPAFDELMAVAGVGTVLFEYAMAFGLWFAPTRRWLVPMGILFHVAIYLTLPVGTFSATTCLLYLAFYPPDAVHRTIDRLFGATDPTPRGEPASPAAE